MSRFASKDELLDAQTLRVAGTSVSGGADIGECLATAARVSGTDLDSWHREWTALAERLCNAADASMAAGHKVSARSAYFRASNAFRNAGVMLLGAPVDRRLVASIERQTEVFRKGAALLESPADVIEIPFEETTLPGYFFSVSSDSVARPTVILTGGYDGTAEELFFLTGAAALARGYNVITFDGPGQGSALVRQGLLLRSDWETVVGAVVDFAMTRPEVDSNRIALIGLSLGAHLAPRAAAREHRLAACVADGGSFDLFASALERIPEVLRQGYLDGRPLPTKLITKVLTILERKPTAGWALRRGQLVHGVDSPTAYLTALKDFSLREHAPLITCPTLVCYAEGDDIGASAPELYEALKCPKQIIRFTAEEGAGDHCEAGARALFCERAFDFLDETLR